MTMDTEFSAQVEEIMGPMLKGLGFTIDEIDDTPDKGGRRRNIVYYRSSDCKLQVYEYSREGEFNCMIAPLDAPNAFGLDAKRWQFLTRFSKRPDLPLAELAAQARAEYESYANPLEWVRDRIAEYYESAHAGILELYGTD